MTTHLHICIVIRCDTCTQQLGHDDHGTLHFTSRAEAALHYGIADNPDNPSAWQITDNPATGTDLCPDCICARDGHLPQAFDLAHQPGERIVEICQRCNHFLPDRGFAEQPPAEPAPSTDGMQPLPVGDLTPEQLAAGRRAFHTAAQQVLADLDLHHLPRHL